MIDENKQEVCDAICNALRTTRSAGDLSGNPLVELRYLPEGNGVYSEVVRPIFADGCGSDGYYDINVACDSGIAIFIDVVRQFVVKVW